MSAPRTRAPLGPVGGRLVGLALVLAPVVFVAGCSQDRSVAPPAPVVDQAAQRADSGQRVLTAFAAALEGRSSAPDAGATLAASDPQSRTDLAAALSNATRLRVRDVRMRYVQEEPGQLTAAERRRFGDRAWEAVVDARYTLAGYDTGPTELETSVVLVPGAAGGDGRARIASIGGHDRRSALWMRGPVQVLSSPDTLVIVAGDRPATAYEANAEQAVRDVHEVLPGWRGKLVLEVPENQAELESVLHVTTGEYAAIAGVTASVDGSLQRGSPVHVFLNPAVYDPLGPRGAQVVVSHETTHVATGAPFSSMATWLLEGFADYVALDHAGVPVQVAGSQFLAQVRKSGLPTALPSATDFSPTAPGLGAIYEEAWLACRSVGQRFGEDRLVRLYRRVDAGTDVATAFRTVLGVSQQRFVQEWRQDLRALAAAPTQPPRAGSGLAR